ncbi:SseB family protein [Micromonospora sp. NPDC047074]|uniref:SseB family protein n=1 Tax=Micromonospora sp. NPDC047074 TaxID=3154339 RepID=UPI0033D7FAEB
MTEWAPATEAEAAMRDALRANDQQLYFRVLARTELLLPVAAEAHGGRAPVGWGTWTTGGRTHVLAFTSGAALRACLGENGGGVRRTAFADLADGWPDHEWWLAVNPGLPVEGYLPAWFVAQLARGDVRLPGRTMGARARLERVETAARARANAAGNEAPGGPGNRPTTGGAPATGTPTTGGAPATGTPTTGAAPTTGTPWLDRTAASSAGHAPARPGGPAGHPDLWHGDPAAGGPTRLDTPAAADRVAPPRPAPLTERPRGLPPPDTQPTPSTNGRPAGEAPDRQNRSFFEPASGRAAAHRQEALRSGERATPPPRIAPGSQPFPRRRPLTEPVPMPAPAPEETTRPIRIASTDGEPTRAFAVPGAEATQVLPPHRPATAAEDVTRDLRAPAPSPGRPPGHAGRPPEPAEEATQPLPRRRPVPEPGGPDPVAEPPSSAAEPVSAPPAPRRGFTPIVIEGTIVESRDVTGPSAAEREAAAEETVSLFEPVRRRRESVTPGPPAAAPAPPAPHGPPPQEPATLPVDAPAPFSADAPATLPDEPVLPVDEPVALTEPAAEDAPPLAGPAPADFRPANEVEENLLDAAGAGSTDTFLSTLLLARVLLPVAAGSGPGSGPGDPGFVWRTEELDGETFVVVYTSPERLADHTDVAVETIEVRFVQLIRRWPEESWSFAVNPGTPVGAKLPGEQIVGLANWAAEVGLGDDVGAETEPPAAEEPVSRPRYAPPAPDPARPIVMQKAVAASQLAYYLERGYDRVSGFVHRAGELAHLNTPAQLHEALGLGYPDSPFARDAEEIYVLRWPAHRPSLYRIPYGGQNEAAMRAMEGWVIERPPFRGNGFAPGESSDVVAEFKVDSARLPHGAQLWRIGADGTERVVAILDTDALRWRQVGEQ